MPLRATSMILTASFLLSVYAQLPGELLDTLDLPPLTEKMSSNETATTLDTVAEILAIPGEDLDKGNCQLLGPLALGIQAAMGVIVLGSLLLKRARERPKRPWKIWALDVSKQVLGQAYLHFTNVAISDVIANHSNEQQNPCTLYLLNILVDTTVGVLILYLCLRFFSWVLISRCHLTGLETGHYGDPPKASYWFKQLGVYLLALTLMKGCVVAFFALVPQVFDVGDKLLSWLGNNVEAQVVFTMMIIPIIMNVLQFMIIDTIIKGRSQFSLLPEDEEAPARASISSSADDDDSDRTFVDHEATEPETTQTAHDISSAKARRKDLKHSIGADIIPSILPIGDVKPASAETNHEISPASRTKSPGVGSERRLSYGATRIEPPEEGPLKMRIARRAEGDEVGEGEEKEA